MVISNFLQILGAYLTIAGLLMFIVVWFTIGPHYDKKFKNTFNPLQKGNLAPKSFMRAGQYSILVIFGKGMRKSYDRMVFGNYDFKKDARLIDKIVAYLTWIPFASGCVLCVIGLIVQWVGY